MYNKERAKEWIMDDVDVSLSSLEFMKDSKGDWHQVVSREGWYQSKSGELYHYDGVIWDEVPKERLEELEYLG